MYCFFRFGNTFPELKYALISVCRLDRKRRKFLISH